MKVLLIYLTPPARWQKLRYQQGIGSLSAVLKAAGHQTELLILSAFDPEALAKTFSRFQPDLTGISVTSNFFPLACELARTVAADYRCPVILGGIHPTLSPEESIAADGVFAICRGEGEYPLRDLCEALAQGRDPANIPNLWVKQGTTITRNELRPLINPLDDLPYPDREIFHFERFLEDFGEAEFMGSRGCPFRCAYCANHALVKLYRGKGPYVRFRSVDHLLGEIEQVQRRYSCIDFLGFHDDTLTLNPAWFREFCVKYPARFRFPFWCNATADSITEETVALLKAAGCYEVRMGVESGNDRIRMEILEKPVKRESIIRAFRLLREAGIHTYAFNMVGLPYETPETLEDTVRLNQLIRPHEVFCSVFYPYPQTRAWDICQEKGWIKNQQVSSYFESEYALDQPSVTREQVLWYHSIFKDLVRWPRSAAMIKCLHRVKVSRNKTAWNAIRRLRAKGLEWSAQLKRQAPSHA